MIYYQYKHCIFYALTLILFACNSEQDNNQSLQNIVNPQQGSINRDHSSHHQKETENKQDTGINELDIEKLPKGKVLLTASQTNALQQDFNKFELELTNIKFTVKPDGIDKTIDIDMHKNNSVNKNTDESMPIDLTYLNSNNYLLLHEMPIPTGTITAITLSFSGSNSHIELHPTTSSSPTPPPPTKTYLVDPFFASYSKDDAHTHGKRTRPTELVTKTDIKLTQDSYQYININIDKNMTAGLDPYFVAEDVSSGSPKLQYLQFTPIAKISTIEKGASIPIVITSKKPFSDSNIHRSSIVNTITSPPNEPHSDKNYICITATLKTDDQAQLDNEHVAAFPSPERLLDYMRGLYKSHTPITSTNQFLHLRTSLNPEVTYWCKAILSGKRETYIYGFPMIITHPFNTSDNLVFNFITDNTVNSPTPLPDLKFQVGNMVINTDSSVLDTDPVEHLILPRDQKGQYTIVYTGRVNARDFTLLPDSIHTYNNSTDFYKEIAGILYRDYENNWSTPAYKVIMVSAEGEYTHPDFVATTSMKVIITGDLDAALTKWMTGLTASIGGGLIILNFLPFLPKAMRYIKDDIAKGRPLNFHSISDFIDYLSYTIFRAYEHTTTSP